MVRAFSARMSRGEVWSVSSVLNDLAIIHYPDPRLRKVCEPVTEFNSELDALVRRMFEIMRSGKGVGLAASQLGVTQRLFIMNPSGEPDDLMVFVNPEIRDMHGSKEHEEGCLSLPEIYGQIRRATQCTIRAQDLTGKPFELEGSNLMCRVWQHETDHLNGTLIIDRMGPGDKIKVKKKLKELEATYRERRP
jgi:peptide deformylase